MKLHNEHHRVDRTAWLRAAVLGANDGLISTSSLIIGVAAAHAGTPDILVAGLAGLVGGSLSMAAGEYVSVSSQADSQSADLARERRELSLTPEAEHRELAGIYVSRGLTPELADQVATQLTAHDALAAHARDELGITDTTLARPLTAAIASAGSFALGAVLPLLVAVAVSAERLTMAIFVSTLMLLVALGALAAWLGGAQILRGALRVGFWGLLAMAATGLIGHLFDVHV
jgi:VIT1/CCC1 family predicted Fe2+/Mn2+ transporter